MTLSHDGIISYLLQRGQLSKQGILEEGVSILQMLGDKPVFKVISGRDRLVVKQCPERALQDILLLEKEYLILKTFEFAKKATPQALVVPKAYSFDAQQKLLVTEYLPYDTALIAFRRDAFDQCLLAEAAARALRAIHAFDAGRFTQQKYVQLCFPYILSPDEFKATDLSPKHSAAAFDIIRSDHQLHKSLKALGRKWKSDSLIHCDVKLDNIIVSLPASAESTRSGRARVRKQLKPRLWLIDWATASVGDPAWDLATLIQSVLTLWSHSMNFKLHQTYSDAASNAALPWSVVRSFIARLLQAYTGGRLSGCSAQTRQFSRRAIAYAGAALLSHELANSEPNDAVTSRKLAACCRPLSFGQGLFV